MTLRTVKSTVTFANPFTLSDLGEVLPPGTYPVETEEELIEGLSFQVYRRVRTLFHLPGGAGAPGLSRILTLDPEMLDEALERDNASNAA